ncbi:probable terpene synthase 2 [Vigna radiata var. radiata]|uniref:Probable terpene synthase 2 n=1 Tax=Vigna radiata var. radiata TaxID=3916 RepID=A0A1S3VUF2_VIGRR|nr:probable terpene synthase 2 [Vigna radiata var. radiata]
MSLAPSLPVASIQHAVPHIIRPSVNFPPNIWGDFFLQYHSESLEVNTKELAQKLKEEVKMMFQSSIRDIKYKLNLIDSLQRFSLPHLFQQEINNLLEQIHHSFIEDNTIIEDNNYHSLALLFRLFRQQGYRISSDIFKKLKNEEGNFNETLGNDIEGLCSLYEAAQMRTHGDDILEEICDFSKTQLRSLVTQLEPSLVGQVNHCLNHPLNKSVPRFEAKYHMSVYEQHCSHDETLLKFAKVKFNILQRMHQKEIGTITKWWKKSNFEQKVPHARNRIVECYLWLLAMSYLPEYSSGRIFAGKLAAIIVLLDDTYDAYGTVEELQLFTEAFQRWDIRLTESLPRSMKVIFEAILELCEEIEELTTESGNSNFVVPHFKQAVSNLVKCYLVEAKWCNEGYIPTYDEYKINGMFTSCCPIFATTFIGLADFATKDVLDWILSNPDILRAASVIARVLDDMASHRFEQERLHVASAVECCMKQYSISEAEAYNLIHKDVEDCWKVINEECLKSNDIPMIALDCIANYARMAELSYEGHKDKFTNAELLKDYVSSLLVDSFCLDQTVI